MRRTCGGSKVAIPAILSRLPDPVLAVRLQDCCKVSPFGRALHTTWTKRRQRAGQLRGMGSSFLRSQSKKVAIFRAWPCSAGNRPLYIQI